MASRQRISLHKGIVVVAFLALAGASVWAFQNRGTLAAACLNTINGITSKVAHLNEPFGLGATVQPKNPVLGVVPDFSLTGQDGRTVKKSDLLGSCWVASFIFTRCATTCPMAIAELKTLQTSLPEEVRLVSFSVDPEHDSPEVLGKYAKNLGADMDRWLFLTGEKTSVYRYIREGFHLAVEANEEAPTGWEVTHSPRFALVDPKGRIRGYYDSLDPTDLERLREDAERLTELERLRS